LLGNPICWGKSFVGENHLLGNPICWGKSFVGQSDLLGKIICWVSLRSTQPTYLILAAAPLSGRI
jgi:hypothetical protein